MGLLQKDAAQVLLGMASVSQELPLLVVVLAVVEAAVKVVVVAEVVAVVVAALSLRAQQVPRQVLCPLVEVPRH